MIAPPAGSGFNLVNLEFDPPAAPGALYLRGASEWTWLPHGPNGSILAVVAGSPTWVVPTGIGDMLAATYDPTGVAGDAFNFANMRAAGAINGDILVRSGGSWTIIHAGFSGRVLTSNGIGAVPSYQPIGGDMLASTYDPTGVAGDAFNLANMKIAGQTLGDLLLYSGSAWARLADPAVVGWSPVSNGPGVAPSWQRAPFPTNDIDGLNLVWVSVTQIGVIAGVCRCDIDASNIIAAAPFIVDITASGAGGLDTGSEAPSTWYDLYVIAGPAVPIAGLLVVAGGVPVMPPGYSCKRRLGSVRNDAAGDLRAFRQSGRTNDRTVIYNTAIAGRVVLSAGGATAPTAIDCSALIPPGCLFGLFTARNNVTNRVSSLYVTITDPAIDVLNPSESRSMLFPTTIARSIAYRNDLAGGSLTVTVRGYVESV